jgi:excisionase family DNA binding protein
MDRWMKFRVPSKSGSYPPQYGGNAMQDDALPRRRVNFDGSLLARTFGEELYEYVRAAVRDGVLDALKESGLVGARRATAGRLLSVRDVAERLGISRNSAYELVWQGKIASIRLGRRLLVPEHALVAMIEKETQVSQGEDTPVNSAEGNGL